ncbi:hypothetical protein M0813_02194 [Anaeramoeba flamelloides]|uniref:Nucleotidyltransferase n=1 Tax=Anaeramoeba flamelloides TaxID=1746091 RepID=A0ABQ8YQP8_9EUKA|nr:hypothetical protein M0813_02194 [Anaeramoeba flamelloides]
MEKTIQELIRKMEEQYNITVLLCCEAGSREWGLDNPDSDYDIRGFFYHNDKSAYMTAIDSPDSVEQIDFMSKDRIIDFSLWDIKKMFKLLAKSNPSILEWALSTIVYYEKPTEMEMIRNVILKYTCRVPLIYHYLNMSRRNYNRFIKNQMRVKIKKYAYIIRAQVTALWLIQNSQISQLNKNVQDLIKKVKLPEKTRKLFDQVVVLKKQQKSGFGIINSISDLDQVLSDLQGDLFSQIEKKRNQILKDYEIEKKTQNKIKFFNKIFFDLIN